MSHECCFRLLIRIDPDEVNYPVSVTLYDPRDMNCPAPTFQGTCLSGALYGLGEVIEKQINRDALSDWLQRGVEL